MLHAERVLPCQRWAELSCLLDHWARVSRFLSLWSSMCTLVKELRSRNIHRPWQRLKPVGRHREILSVCYEIQTFKRDEGTCSYSHNVNNSFLANSDVLWTQQLKVSGISSTSASPTAEVKVNESNRTELLLLLPLCKWNAFVMYLQL